MAGDPDAALRDAQEAMKQRSSADLIERINSMGFFGEPGPLKNSLEWIELCRRLLER